MEGVQLAGVLSLTRQGLEGIQAGGVVNHVGGDVDGIQAAGVVNHTKGAVDGVQMAGVVNYSAGVDGSQIAGVVNISTGTSEGLQLAGVHNLAGEFTGLQISMVNVARAVSGVQIGLVNIADRMEGAPIGLLNIIGDGMLHLDVWSSDIAPVHVGAKMGSKHFYSIIAGAVRPGAWDALDIDALYYHLVEGDSWPDDGAGGVDGLVRGRVTLRWAFREDVALFGGPAVNLLISRIRDGSGLDPLDWRKQEIDENGGLHMAYWPGLVLGVEAF